MRVSRRLCGCGFLPSPDERVPASGKCQEGTAADVWFFRFGFMVAGRTSLSRRFFQEISGPGGGRRGATETLPGGEAVHAPKVVCNFAP